MAATLKIDTSDLTTLKGQVAKAHDIVRALAFSGNHNGVASVAAVTAQLKVLVGGPTFPMGVQFNTQLGLVAASVEVQRKWLDGVLAKMELEIDVMINKLNDAEENNGLTAEEFRAGLAGTQALLTTPPTGNPGGQSPVNPPKP